MFIRLPALCALIIGLVGCSVPHLELGPRQHYSFVAEATAVERANVELFLGVGTLTVEPGSEDVLEADCCTNVRDFHPRLHQQRRDGVLSASLSSSQQSLGFNVWDTEDLEHTWQVRLGREVPMSLVVDFGAGEADLELGGLPLQRLDVDVGAAEVVVNFAEPNPEVLGHLSVDAGAAAVDLTGLGNANLERMTVECGIGEYRLDFGGKWTRSAKVDIEGGIGEVVIRVPDDIGVRVTTDDTFLASVSAGHLHETRKGYINDQFGACEVLLDIHVEFSFGEIRILGLEEEDPDEN